jgi:alpha-tubulin suppressor-like RCC1 family protein
MLTGLKRLAEMGINPVQIISGNTFTCILADDGTLWNWGFNTKGQLGRVIGGITGGVQDYTFFPEQMDSATLPSDIAMVSCGESHTLLLTTGGEVWSWGDNVYGSLGRTTPTGDNATVNIGKIGSPLPANIKYIVAGDDNSFAITASGQIWSWGRNSQSSGGHCMLGRVVDNGSATVRNVAQSTALPSNLAEIDLAYSHVLARTTTGDVWSWGYNMQGQLGRVVSSATATSANVGKIGTPLPTGIQAIGTNSGASVTLAPNGTLWTFGWNGGGVLGRNVEVGSTTVVNIGQINATLLPVSIKKLVAGCECTAVVTTTGAVWNWGHNNSGQLGRIVATGTPSALNIGKVGAPLPENIQLMDSNRSVYRSSYASASDKNVWSWGGNGGRIILGQENTIYGDETTVNLGKVYFAPQ